MAKAKASEGPYSVEERDRVFVKNGVSYPKDGTDFCVVRTEDGAVMARHPNAKDAGRQASALNERAAR